jgi:L-ascorbate metabolism protein UlaG (beta-lactamase superfamily)
MTHPFEELIVPEKNVGIHWFGQNSFGIKDTFGTIIMVDPYFPRDRPPDEFIYPKPPLDEREIKTDYVLLTHDHGDHTCPESLLRIHAAFPNTRFYGPHECILRLKELGIPGKLLNVMVGGGVEQVGPIIIHSLYSKPPEGVLEDGIPIPDVEHLGYLIESGPVRIYISGDLIHTFSRHDELVMPIRRLKPDIGILTTHPTEGEFPDFKGSVELAERIGVEIAIPAHYGCFIKRTFDPVVWASGFSPDGPQPIIIPYNESMIFSH